MNSRLQQPKNVIQGSFEVGDRSEDVLMTLLGSCVATCLHDPVAGVGGLNHFLLPEGQGNEANSQKYGLNLMELLINALLKKGARRERMEAKLFGGAEITLGLTKAGASNAEFARRFLQHEGIRCVSESLGGNQARKLRFWPATGKAQQMLLSRELPPPLVIPPPPSDDVTFF